jgi:pimeloyl-ACP methyl ester carboxylesterase
MKVFKNEHAKQKIYNSYDILLKHWDVETEERDVNTQFGSTHVIQFGDKANPPLVLFHGVGDNSALMWYYNCKALSEYFSIYAVDTLGGPGKSVPGQLYNKDFKTILWLNEVMNGLQLEKVYIAGVSNGSYLARLFAIRQPGRVIKIISMSGSVLIGSQKSPLINMLKVFLPEALFPTKKNVIKLIKKLTGDNSFMFTDNKAILNHYQDLLQGFQTMSMSYHKLEYFTEAEYSTLKDKALFLCGEDDPLGSREQTETEFQRLGLNYRFYKGVGHGINHEIPEVINKCFIEYFLESSV